MSAPSKLRPLPSPEPQGRPVLRPAGNTATAVPRKGFTPSSKLARIVEVSCALAKDSSSPVFPRTDRPLPPVKSHQDDEGRFTGVPDDASSAEEKTMDSAETLLAGDSKCGWGQVSEGVGRTKTPTCKITTPSSGLERQQPQPGGALAAQRVRTNSTQQRRENLARARQNQGKLGRIVPDALPVYAVLEDFKKRCGWITSQSGPAYVAYHDTEWGVAVHDDRKLFEMFVLVGAQAEMSWPTILERRELYRSAFGGFDPAVVATFDEEMLLSLKANGSIMLHEGKLRGVIENALQVLKVVKEFGSFDRYLWGFVNNKTIVSKHRLPKQVPVKSPKSELISRDMIKRGFRFVGPTIMYSFMQAVGMVNDHLVTCFRYCECNSPQQSQKCVGDRIPEEAPSEEDLNHSLALLYGD